MDPNHILLIEPDDFVASLINKSFIGYDPGIKITSSTDEFLIHELLKQKSSYIIFTDSDFLIQHKSIIDLLLQENNSIDRLILSGYQSLPEDYPVFPKMKQHFLIKPLDARVLNSLIEDIFGQTRNKDLGHFSLTKEQYSKCDSGLIKLRNDINARCIMLSDPVGRVLISTGSLDGISSDTITSLLGGGLATLLEAGKELDMDAVLNLSYREGRKTDLYALNIGKVLILIIIIDKGRFHNKLGTVWYYARQTALLLESIVISGYNVPNQPIFDDVNSDTISDEIDRLINF